MKEEVWSILSEAFLAEQTIMVTWNSNNLHTVHKDKQNI